MKNNSIYGLRVIIRSLQEQYIDDYITQFTDVVRAPLHVKDDSAERLYVEQALIKQGRGETFFYLIFEQSSNILIGALEIRNRQASRGQLYTWLHHDYWGKGFFQEALPLAAADYFAKTNELYFDATVDVTNVRSYKALKKAGFADFGLQEGPWGKQFVLILRNKNLKM